ncbi:MULTISPECIES: hypothetical protein [unclassified Curtobacterium]|uniref:hypothetical protein n=1 Tax=unclassified Curtobacterium TaxID=257496 RepID=UPI003828A4D4
METQSGARTPLVDPFGRELEEWLRDAPATRAPYVSDLVVPPVTGPVQRPDAAAAAEPVLEQVGPDEVEPERVDLEQLGASSSDDTAFRRPRDRGRHASVCAPSFPEPPERLALRIEELAVEVSAQSGRATIERIVILEDEVRRRDEDLARLAAWEAVVADLSDPEIDAARAYARSVFEDLLADAADEADRRDRAAARRAATTAAVTVVAPVPAVEAAPAAAPALVLPPVAAPVVVSATTAVDGASADRDEPARLVPTLSPSPRPSRLSASSAARRNRQPWAQAVTPVSANTRPTPLIQPVTGPTVVDRDTFAAVLRAHRAETAGTPVVFPEEHAAALPETAAEPATSTADVERVESAQPGWWSRVVAAVLRVLGRR